MKTMFCSFIIMLSAMSGLGSTAASTQQSEAVATSADAVSIEVDFASGGYTCSSTGESFASFAACRPACWSGVCFPD